MIMSLTLHVPGNIFHFTLSLCSLSFKRKKGWKGLGWTTLQNWQVLLDEENFGICVSLPFFFFLIYVFEGGSSKSFLCTRTVNTALSMVLWNKMFLEYCLPNQRFNTHIFPIIWREISEYILPSLLHLKSAKCLCIGVFFLSVTSLAPISISHQYSYVA